MNKKINIYKQENFIGMPFVKGLVSFEDPVSVFKLMSHEKKLGIPEDDEVIYQYNSSGLRSDEFTKVHEGKHILFAGCSETEGLGHKLENTWAHQVYSKINESEKISGFFNIGVRALSITAINRQIINYIMMYGKPNSLFVNYPDFYRYYKWNEDKMFWEPRFGLETTASYNLKDKFYLKEFKDAKINDKESFLIDDNLNEEIINTSKLANGRLMTTEYMSDERNSDFVVNSIQSLMLMEEFCKIMEISFIWGSWDPYSSATIRQSKLFNNYVDIGNLKNIYDWAEKNNYQAKDLRARDIGHMGIACHKYWSEQILNKYREVEGK